jgi:hypothetical protein
MAEESESLTIEILRQIQSRLVDQEPRFEVVERRLERMQDQMDHRFDGVERKLGEVIDATTRALGTAAVSNVRHDGVQVHLAEMEIELRDLRSRVRQLEEKV